MNAKTLSARFSSKSSSALILLVILLILSGLRLLLTNPYAMPDAPVASQGVLDLRNMALDQRHTLQLDGQWAFYSDTFIASHPSSRHPSAWINVPGGWQRVLQPGSNETEGYGSYRLRIRLDPAQVGSYKLLIKDIQTSFRIYANGTLVAQAGNPSETVSTHKAEVRPKLAFLPEATEIDLIVEASNFENSYRGGIARSIKFGSAEAIDSENIYNTMMQLVMLISLALHAVYSAIICIFSRNRKPSLLFLLTLVAALFAVSLDESKLLLEVWPIDYISAKKLSLIASSLMNVALFKLTLSFCVEAKKRRKYYIYFALMGLYWLFVIVSPIEWVTYSVKLFLFLLLMLFPILSTPVLLIRYVLEKDHASFFLFIAAAGVTSSMIWVGLKNAGWAEPGFYAFDMLLALIGTVAYSVDRYFRNNAALEKLALRLQAADKQKDDFLAQTSHELRTPLHGIINMADSVLASEGNVLIERSQKDLRLLSHVGKRMNLLLDDLLDLTQIRENRLSLRFETLKIQSVAAGVLDMLRYMTDGKPLELKLNIADDFPSMHADEKRITQVLFNLVHNAIKFTDAGQVSVSAQLKNGQAEIRVSDTGVGIEAVDLERIFTSYEQADSPQRAAGIGLGLSISRSLVRLHGGELQAASQPDQGSVFSFSIPLAGSLGIPAENSEAKRLNAEDTTAPLAAYASAFSDPTERSKPQKSEPATESPTHVLAVDDDPVNLHTLRSMLPAERYRVHFALSGSEALDLLETRSWDVVIADVMMPRMSGYELSRQIRERYSRAELPILLLTARNRTEDIYAGFAAGASDYIAKPADALELNYRIEALTDLKRSIHERLSLEAAYLQAQIQPHFLFNALNSITALSHIDIDKMNEAVEAFSSYLKISFDYWSAQPLVPLERELELVQSYLAIESMRFEDRLRTRIVIADDLDPERILLPPLCIQPLVENAVQHGLLSRSKGGLMSLDIRSDGTNLVFTVQDDGAGMSEEQLFHLLTPVRKGRQGIGLLNTNRRLKQMYGSGLHIDSAPGFGTTVSFVIPRSGLEAQT